MVFVIIFFRDLIIFSKVESPELMCPGTCPRRVVSSDRFVRVPDNYKIHDRICKGNGYLSKGTLLTGKEGGGVYVL